MLPVLGKTLLQHKFDMLPDTIDEVVVVVGHLQDKITEVLGDSYEGKKISYVLQEEQNGTAHALFQCKEVLKNEPRFLVMMGDDIYSHDDMEECLNYDYSILIRKTESLFGKAKVILDDEGHIRDIQEKYQGSEEGFVCAGMYSLTPKIFECIMVQIPGGEYGLPQTILSMKDEVNIKAVEASFWLQISSPEDLEAAEKFLKIG
jgi:NDP-sugar pyrophosphorylase family protein